MNLLDLAPEIVVHVLAYLDFRDVIRTAQVNRKLRNIVDDSLLLKYQKELAVSGMVEGVQSPLTSNTSLLDRYTKLLLYNATWRSLAWRKKETLHMRDSTALWDLYGGVLGSGTPIEGDKEHWRLEFRELDAIGRRGAESDTGHWGFEAELPLVELAMDPTQDLLVLLSVSETPTRTLFVNLRTLSSNVPHPAAKDLGVIQYIPPKANENLFDRRLGSWVVVQIYRTLLGLMVFSEDRLGDDSDDTDDEDGEPSAHLVIWDWTTGEAVTNIVGLRGLLTFSFLSDRYVLLTRRGNVKQSAQSPSDEQINPFGTSGVGMPHQPSLDVYDLSKCKPGSTLHESSFVRRYLLPNVKPAACVEMVRVFSELSTPLPAEPPTPSHKGGRKEKWKSELLSTNENTWIGTGAPAPFTIAPYSRVFVVRIVLSLRRRGAGQIGHHWSWQAPTQEYVLLIPLSTLLPSADTRATDMSEWTLDNYVPLGAPPSLLVKTIAWREWGPRGTRLLPLEHPQNFFDIDRSFYPYGPRVAIPLRSSRLGDSGKFRIRMININQFAVRYFVHSRKGKSPEMINGMHSVVRAVVDPLTISWDVSHFERDVTTCLPYLETVTGEDVAYDCDCFMLTEDNLFTVKAEEATYAVQMFTF